MIQKIKEERSLLDICLELSEYQKDNCVTPVVLDYFRAERDYGLNHYQAIGKLYGMYMPNEVKK